MDEGKPGRMRGKSGRTGKSRDGQGKAGTDGGRLGRKVRMNGGKARAKEFRFLPRILEI